MSDAYTVLLYYKYVRIDDPARFTAEHKAFCERLNLKGRIIIAAEGINGTVAGTPCEIAEYEHAMRENPLFSDIEFKRSEGSPETFPKLSVKCRKEIVSLHLAEDVYPDATLGNHLSAEQWKTMLDEKKGEVVLFDVRNRYESDVGKFQGAIAPPIENFRELPAALAQYEHLKDKTVMMYCTGGIRCEKASALFQREGFKNVFQLHGGIVSYLEKFPKAHWEGDCFVFDQRMVTPLEEPTGKTGACVYTGKPTSNFVNCLHDPCHRLFLLHPETLEKNPETGLCPECRGQGLTRITADYKGSPARAHLPKVRKSRRAKRRLKEERLRAQAAAPSTLETTAKQG